MSTQKPNPTERAVVAAAVFSRTPRGQIEEEAPLLELEPRYDSRGGDIRKRTGLVLDVGGYRKNVSTQAPALTIFYDESALVLKFLDRLHHRVTRR
ncbi:MAG: hypothetical protein JO172_01840 [Hyphomicrobiales bacterium]|nr:hypothetical protein [Hyphomicrobiales bacterium]